jgi:hypothetical protein
MIVVLLLYFLATIDAACSGYRAACGRNALIHKEAYYRSAILRGALAGQATVAISGLGAVIMLFSASDPDLLWSDFLRAGELMVLVYVPYAVLVLAAFVLRIVASVNLRSLVSVLVFGPFTLIRPVVVVAGVMWALISVRRVEVVALGLLVLILRLSVERALERRRTREESALTMATDSHR